jgi:hypothetical protein
VGKVFAIRATWVVSLLTLAVTAAILAMVLRSLESEAGQGNIPTALTALAVIFLVFGVAGLIKRIDLSLHAAFAWMIGVASFAFAFVPWAFLTWGDKAQAAVLYRGLRIPQGIERFWDLALVTRSVDCDAWGFNVFVDNNGCLQDAAIYGPGMLWLQYVPFSLFSFAHVLALGVAMMAISSLALVWLARQSTGLGQVTLLAAALGTPWLLLLERGNIDVVLIWVAIVAVIIIRRWPSLLTWSIAAGLLWVVGTWKYYPFAMGIMLIPVLRLRRGWIVLLAYGVASVGYVLGTWSNFKFSMQSNSNMTEVGDYVVLGRVPVVSRMFGSVFPSQGIQLGDVLVFLLALCAVLWGVCIAIQFARRIKIPAVHESMLGAAGSGLFLASVLVGGFGWAYKAAFLLLGVPLLSWLVMQKNRQAIFAGVTGLALTAVCSIVVWNTLLASLAGIIAASIMAGLSFSLMVLSVARQMRSRATSEG